MTRAPSSCLLPAPPAATLTAAWDVVADAKRGYLLFSGIHFDAASVGGRRLFEPAEQPAADAAVAVLALERRAAGGFTDQSTMRLRCKTCGHIMVGDLEARQHAGSSGHKDFVQATS